MSAISTLEKYIPIERIKKKLCFYQRISLIVATTFTLVIIFFLLLSDYLHDQKHIESNHLSYQQMAENIANNGDILKNEKIDVERLLDIFSTLQLANPSFHFHLLDPQGNILHKVSDGVALPQAQVDVTAIETYISSGYTALLMSEDPKERASKFIYSAAPIVIKKSQTNKSQYEESQGKNLLAGYIFIVTEDDYQGSLFYKIQNSSAYMSALLIAIVGLVFLFSVMLALFKVITSPLRKLTNDMIAFKEAGNKGCKAKMSSQVWCADSRSEVDKLGCAFNDLTFQINAQFDALDQSLQQRKEMLADLSHDLRTPLASMQGYMETLHMNGDSLSEEDRARFISVCMRNMTNLKQLIDQIFELAYLEGGQVKVTKEPCLLGEFLYDIVDKFKISAKAKDISIVVEPEHASFLINTDLGKLERVLSNLLDNAIRHTPHNGTIRLNVSEENGVLSISIEDNGIGIASHELENIFTPRYQASNSQSTTEKNAGLGLAISKKLTTLLGADLSVKSETGKGTTFRFSLPNP